MPAKGQEADVIERMKAKTYYFNNCWLFTGKLTRGKYGNIWYKGKMVRTSRLVCHLFHGADLDDLSWTANHKRECNQPSCWNPDHLYVGTQAQNVADQIATNSFHYGSANLNVGENFDYNDWLKKKREGK